MAALTTSWGPFGQDSDLRRHGEKIASRGAKNAKKRAASGRGEEVGGATSQFVGERGSLRSAAQRPPPRRPGSLKEEAKPKKNRRR